MKDKKKYAYVHQGDVLLIPCCIPTGAKFLRKEVVAYGEVTGHKHFIRGASIMVADNEEYVLNPLRGKMEHDEHPAEVVDAPSYKIRIQTEYFPSGRKKVVD